MLLLLLPTTIIKMKVDQDQLNYEDNNEDSSYDSDNEVTHSSHPSVSRNVSETLGQELCDDYNSVSIFLMIFFSSFIHSIPSSSSSFIYRISRNVELLLLFLIFFSLHTHTSS